MAPIYLALAIVFNATANSLFKTTSAIPDLSFRKAGLFVLALFIGLVNTLCFVKALEKIELGTSYPVFSAGSIILISLISAYIFHESFTAQRIVGILVTCAGMFLIWRA